MSALTYTRYELLRTFRNRRFFFFSLGFPLVLYFLIAGPNRNEHDFGGTGISAPLYFMVGLASFGTMSAMLAGGARIAGERAVGWNRQLRITPLSHAGVLPREGADRATRWRCVTHRRCSTSPAPSLGVSLPAGDWLQDDRPDPRRAGPVRGARHPDRPPADARLDRAGRWAAATALLALLGGTWFPIAGTAFLHDIAQVAALLLARAGRPRRARRAGAGARRGWLVMAVWTVVLGALAVRAYRRDTGRV